ncbi:hypothetical protein ACROYT_G027589 [Oculina patagonica]
MASPDQGEEALEALREQALEVSTLSPASVQRINQPVTTSAPIGVGQSPIPLRIVPDTDEVDDELDRIIGDFSPSNLYGDPQLTEGPPAGVGTTAPGTIPSTGVGTTTTAAPAATAPAGVGTTAPITTTVPPTTQVPPTTVPPTTQVPPTTVPPTTRVPPPRQTIPLTVPTTATGTRPSVTAPNPGRPPNTFTPVRPPRRRSGGKEEEEAQPPPQRELQPVLLPVLMMPLPVRRLLQVKTGE